jgi:two-component system NtrC family sensor kinase
MNDVDPIREFVTSQRAPLRIWLGAAAAEQSGAALKSSLGGEGEILQVPSAGTEPTGPAILVLTPNDLAGADREPLLKLALRAQPGRPVVVGGAHSKDTLLDAINVWQVFRLVHDATPADAIVDAVRAAHRALTLELSVELCARILRQECQRLAGALDELHATQQQLLHAERLTTVGRIVGALLTQAKDQLAAVEQCRRVLEGVRSPGPLKKHIGCAIEGIKSFDTLLKDMLALAENRSEHARLLPEELDALVESSARLFSHDPLGRSRVIRTACQSAATVGVDRHRMCHVLINLLRNAAQASGEGDPIEVRTSRDGNSVLIEVQDTGLGMTPEFQDMLFTAFVTTKGAAGMGLGLRLAKATVERHGGSIDCSSKVGEGTCFRIRLPLAG